MSSDALSLAGSGCRQMVWWAGWQAGGQAGYPITDMACRCQQRESNLSARQYKRIQFMVQYVNKLTSLVIAKNITHLLIHSLTDPLTDLSTWIFFCNMMYHRRSTPKSINRKLDSRAGTLAFRMNGSTSMKPAQTSLFKI